MIPRPEVHYFPLQLPIMSRGECLVVGVGRTIPGVCVGGVESVPDWKTPAKQRGSGWKIQE